MEGAIPWAKKCKHRCFREEVFEKLSSRSWGIGQGEKWASAANCLNSCQQKREIASATLFSTPGTWKAVTVKPQCAAASRSRRSWNLRGPGRENSNYCLIIWSKKDMLPSLQRSPKVSSNHHRKKFLVCNRLPGLHSWPGTIKPLASRKGTKANHTSHIQGDLQVCGSRHARIQPEPNSMPRGKKLLPPLKIKTKPLVNPYGWSLLLRQHSNKTTKKGSPWPNYLSSVV